MRYEVYVNGRTMVATDNRELAENTAKWYMDNMAVMKITEVMIVDFATEWTFTKTA